MNTLIAVAVIGLSVIVTTAKADTTSPGLGDLLLATAKAGGAYIATNGIMSVSSGFTGFGSGKLTIAPVVAQSLTIAAIGKAGTDTLSFGIEHATSFQPKANRECLGINADWHVWKLSKVGRIFALNFKDAGLAAGVDAPVEWFGGRGIRGSQLVLRLGAFAHF